MYYVANVKTNRIQTNLKIVFKFSIVFIVSSILKRAGEYSWPIKFEQSPIIWHKSTKASVLSLGKFNLVKQHCGLIEEPFYSNL